MIGVWISGVLGGLAAIPSQRRCGWFLKSIYFSLIAYLCAEILKQRPPRPISIIEIQSAGPPPTPYPRVSFRWRKCWDRSRIIVVELTAKRVTEFALSIIRITRFPKSKNPRCASGKTHDMSCLGWFKSSKKWKPNRPSCGQKTKKRKGQVQMSELFAEEKCSSAVPDFPRSTGAGRPTVLRGGR